jgi:diguanylate cyclase (GGDEF)-like protein/PAS domain S-box-containing protein
MKADRLPLATVIDLLLDAVCVVDDQGRYLFVNAGYERILGYRAEEVIGRPMIELVHPDDRERTLQAAREIMGGEPKLHFHNRYVGKDGRVVDMMWAARWSERDHVRVAVGRDITELKRSESMQDALLAISEAAHTAEDPIELFARIHQIIGKLLPAANCFLAMLDARSGMVEFPYFVDEHDFAPAPLPLASATLSNEVIRTGRALLIKADQQTALPTQLRTVIGHNAVDWLGVPLRSANGVIGALVVQSYDGGVRYTEGDQTLLEFVSAQIASAIERKRNQAWLQHLAGHDPLTELPNRGQFHARLEQALAAAVREQQTLALLYLDLDGFKEINDRHGHDLGDLLLQEVGKRIRRCVRQSDLVGRLGGDEFVVLLERIDRPHALAIAEAIRVVLTEPFALGQVSVRLSTSIGVAFHPEHGSEKAPLLRRADDAMYQAKKQGGNRFSLA